MKILIPATAALLLLGTAAGQAAWSEVSGTITSLDKGKSLFVLSDGQTYALRPDVKASDLAVGNRVTVSTEKQDGVNMVRSIRRG